MSTCWLSLTRSTLTIFFFFFCTLLSAPQTEKHVILPVKIRPSIIYFLLVCLHVFAYDHFEFFCLIRSFCPGNLINRSVRKYSFAKTQYIVLNIQYIYILPKIVFALEQRREKKKNKNYRSIWKVAQLSVMMSVSAVCMHIFLHQFSWFVVDEV